MKDLLRQIIREAEQKPLSPLAITSLAQDLGYSHGIARIAELIVLSDGWLTRNERGHLIPSKKLIQYRQIGWDADLEHWRRELYAYRTGKEPPFNPNYELKEQRGKLEIIRSAIEARERLLAYKNRADDTDGIDPAF